MASKADIQLATLASEIEAVQLVLVAYLTGIAEASPGGHDHIETVFRLAGKLADTTAELTRGEQQSDRARRVQKAIKDLEALTL
ncbi:MAG TPA: hypothetical protein VJV39_10525 [Dongiaceae bacterium]|nr:hypothetical protein [Dongiaceae bacterium]